MARSFHTTRRAVRELEAEDWADRAIRGAELRRLEQELATKRRVKAQIDEARHAGPRPDLATPPAAVPIVVEDHGRHVHHAITPDDVRGVLARLPPGTADGLAAVVLGRITEPGAPAPFDEEPTRDPYTGAPAVEMLPGVYATPILGWYLPDRATIVVSAVAYDATTLREAAPKLLLARLRGLTTLVHELGHHVDHTTRVGRGRWRADRRPAVERYAEDREHAWALDAVVPYLEAADAAGVAALRGWLRTHGGLDATLAELLDDPRTTTADGGRRFRFTRLEALAALFAQVEAGDDPLALRVGFAEELHYTDEYRLPRRILDALLAAHPDHADALVVAADLDVHEGAPAMAEARCRAVLARDPRHAGAWDGLIDALAALARWDDVVAAVAQALPWLSPGQRPFAVAHRARAHLERGDDAALERDLCGLALGRRMLHRVAMLRARQLLRLGRAADALAVARVGQALPGGGGSVELAAVVFEAAMRLGQPAATDGLDARQLERLGWLGHAAWVAALRAAYPEELAPA